MHVYISMFPSLSLYIYIYIYIYVCGRVHVCVCVCILGEYFFVITYLIKQYRHPLSTHFCIDPFESPHRFYETQRELVNKPLMINLFQCSTTQPHRNQNREDTSEKPKWLLEKSIHDITNFDCQILEDVHAKYLEATILFLDFSKAFDSIHRGKTEQILLTYVLLKETVAAIMILYKNMKVKVCSPDRDTDYFDIVAGALQGDTLATYLFIICLDSRA